MKVKLKWKRGPTNALKRKCRKQTSIDRTEWSTSGENPTYTVVHTRIFTPFRHQPWESASYWLTFKCCLCVIQCINKICGFILHGYFWSNRTIRYHHHVKILLSGQYIFYLLFWAFFWKKFKTKIKTSRNIRKNVRTNRKGHHFYCCKSTRQNWLSRNIFPHFLVNISMVFIVVQVNMQIFKKDDYSMRILSHFRIGQRVWALTKTIKLWHYTNVPNVVERFLKKQKLSSLRTTIETRMYNF